MDYSEKIAEKEKETQHLTEIVSNMGKLIDYFVMLHYLTKEMQETQGMMEALAKYLKSLMSIDRFNIKNMELFISINSGKILKVSSVDTENVELEAVAGDTLYLEELLTENECVIDENLNSIFIPVKSQNIKLIVKILNDSKNYDTEFIRIIEVFSIQAVSILESIFLRTKIEEKAKKLEQTNIELEAKNKELKELHIQVVQHEKLASIGQLAAGVAHELNNPIGFILGNFNALKKYMDIMIDFAKLAIVTGDEDEKKTAWAKNDIDFIIEDMPALISESDEGLQRVITIVKNLKEFSRIDNNKEDYDINKGIENTLIVARNEYKYIADIEKKLGEVPLIRANGSEINEVILNIIVNAAQAIEGMKTNERKKIKIETFLEGGKVVCILEDNGPGIPEKIVTKIFDPFFTTKEPGKGTGLGLNIAYTIITKKHNGEIKVESEYNKGTKFIIKLPIE